MSTTPSSASHFSNLITEYFDGRRSCFSCLPEGKTGPDPIDDCCGRTPGQYLLGMQGEPLRADISWVTFSPNMMTAKGADGDDWFRRTTSDDYDVALGRKGLTSGRWEWFVWVLQPEDSFVGVATFDCSKDSGNDPHKVWDITASNLELNSENPCRVSDVKHFKGAAFCGDSCKIRVLLDMDERTLSFSRNDEPMALAYTGLPAKVHPYLMSGAAGEVFCVPACEYSLTDMCCGVGEGRGATKG